MKQFALLISEWCKRWFLSLLLSHSSRGASDALLQCEVWCHLWPDLKHFWVASCHSWKAIVSSGRKMAFALNWLLDANFQLEKEKDSTLQIGSGFLVLHSLLHMLLPCKTEVMVWFIIKLYCHGNAEDWEKKSFPMLKTTLCCLLV